MKTVFIFLVCIELIITKQRNVNVYFCSFLFTGTKSVAETLHVLQY